MSFQKQKLSQSVQVAIEALLILRYNKANYIRLHGADTYQQFSTGHGSNEKLLMVANLCAGAWQLMKTHEIIDDSDEFDIHKSRVIEFEIKNENGSITTVSISLIYHFLNGVGPIHWHVSQVQITGQDQVFNLSATNDFPQDAILSPEMKSTMRYYLLAVADTVA